MRISELKMKKFFTILACFLASCGTVDGVKSKFEEQSKIIKSENTVTPEDALETLRRANRKSAFNYSVSRQSVAHVVFPKIVKGGFLLGGNYGEGYLIRDGEVMALVDVSGGNLGLQAGGLIYQQLTYILSIKNTLNFLIIIALASVAHSRMAGMDKLPLQFYPAMYSPETNTQ